MTLNLQLFYWTYLALLGGYALVRGGANERVAIIIIGVASAVSPLIASATSVRFTRVDWGLLAIDIATLVAFTTLAILSDRFWPLWISSLQLLSVSTHVLMLGSPDLVPRIYAWVQGAWAYPIILLVAIGAWRHHRRRASDAGRFWLLRWRPSATTLRR